VDADGVSETVGRRGKEMSSYIDADKLVKKKVWLTLVGKPAEVVFVKDIKKAETVDLVEVVRCKDCTYRDYCAIWKAAGFDEDFFCKKGDKRNDD
jgi:hypothetical protein